MGNADPDRPQALASKCYDSWNWCANRALLFTDQVRRADFPDVPPSSSRTPRSSLILAPVCMESGASFICSEPLGVLCLKNSQMRARNLLAYVVKLGTPAHAVSKAVH
jgi:hypothetical protein